MSSLKWQSAVLAVEFNGDSETKKTLRYIHWRGADDDEGDVWPKNVPTMNRAVRFALLEEELREAGVVNQDLDKYDRLSVLTGLSKFYGEEDDLSFLEDLTAYFGQTWRGRKRFTEKPWFVEKVEKEGFTCRGLVPGKRGRSEVGVRSE